MAAFVEVGTATLAFGLAWKQVSAKHEKADAAALVRKHRAGYKIKWASGSEIRYGVATKPKSAGENRKGAGKKALVLSGAALFASKVQGEANSLLVLPIDANRSKYALVAVVAGSPYLDVVVAPGHVRERVESLRQEGYAGFVEYGFHPDLPNAVEWARDDLLSGSRQAALMSKTSDRGPLLTKIAIAVAICAACGWSMVSDYMAEQEEAESAKTAVNPAVEYSAKLKSILQTAGFSGDAAIAAFWTPRSSREVTVEGWAAQSVVCTRSVCTEKWARQFGTNESMIAQMPKGCTYNFGASKETGDTMYIVCTPTLKASPMDAATFPKKAPFWLAFASEAQRLDFSKEFIGDLRVTYTPAPSRIVGVPSGIDASKIPKAIVVEQGTYTATGPLGLMQETLARTGSNMAIEEVGIDIASGVEAAKFTVKGSFYVKN
jgi:hypothetical protein